MDSTGENVDDILSFNPTDKGVTVVDHIENRKCNIYTPNKLLIKKSSADKFKFPVDKAISITSNKLTITHTNSVYVRNHDGIIIEEVNQGESQTLLHDDYIIEISFPMKIYIRVESKIEMKVTSEQVTICFADLNEALIGARSHHERPSTTIKVTSEPEDLMQAISYFGSALKTTKCERSYPTLRGHPPEFDLSDELMIPSILEKPKTNITIEVPENYREIFVVASLAYYLGANVVPGDTALIKSNEGVIHNLENTSRGFENEVERVFQQCFFFDCITRTEGLYKANLYERKEVESELDLDFSALYNQPISDQVRSYLNVPYASVSDLIPMWTKISHLDMNPGNIEILPYLTSDLSIIQSINETCVQHTDPDFQPDKSNQARRNINSNRMVRGGSDLEKPLRSNTEDVRKLVKVSASRASEHTWVGDGIPIGASKAIIAAYENRLDQKPTDGNIDIAVVVNDEEMIQEGVIVDDVYKSRDQLALNTEFQQKLTTEQLRKVLDRQYDFLHYVGHIDENGFQCVDGELDATNLDNISVETFLLNACTSYQQAIELIRSGAVAGIATIKPILNSGAERIGRVVAQLLNLGFPLISALKIAKSESIMGGNYIVIGDGSVNLTQPTSAAPSICRIKKEDDKFHTIYKTFPTKRESIGTLIMPYAKNNKKYYLASGKTGEFKMSRNELLRFISMGKMPIRFNSSLYWSEENAIVKELE